MQAIGIDFGTTNTVFAFPEGNMTRVEAFRRGEDVYDTLRTTLSFRRNPVAGGGPLAEAGPWAIQDFIDAPEDTRFLQSFKSFAASASFADTAVFTRRYRFEDLMAAYLERVREHTEMGRFPRRLAIGRPVTFAGQSPDDALAQRRYATALASLGFEQVTYVLEPVAAAYFYAQRLTRDAVILVADLGGGTSDFSVLRFDPRGAMRVQPLGYAGIGIAGDNFDFRIIDRVVSPLLGKGDTYSVMGAVLPVPPEYFAGFARWHRLSLMRSPRTLRAIEEVAAASAHPDRLRTLIRLIEDELGYQLYQTVSAVKAELSRAESAVLRFAHDGFAIERRIGREEFEDWIGEDLRRMGATV